MGSYMNFKNFGETPQNQATGSKPPASIPLIRQSSVYSLTFDEFQNTLGESGKDFGSMNMDELLKNIWTAEETQSMATSTIIGQGSSSNNLHRQGSLSLPRTLSQKTVDEVWKELFKENSGINLNSGINPNIGTNLPQQQPTLKEITLQEFLFRAGVVREDAPQMARPDNNGFYNNNNNNNTNTGLGIGFQQSAQNNIGINNNRSLIFDANNSNLVVPSQPNMSLFPKQAAVTFASSMPITNNTQIANTVTRGPIVGIEDSRIINNGLFQGGGLVSGGKMNNNLSPDVTQISNGETSSVSPSPYMINGGARGRKNGTLEKAMERRHRRMIKNRESAARSRSRKQAYTLELEAEVEKLKEMNNELRKKQDELMEMQKNQATETNKTPWGNKRQCLRRTLTGPW